MSLATFQIAREEVNFQGGSLSLRGLSLNDISFLIKDYLAELDNLFKMYAKEDQRETALAESGKFAITIVRECPQMAAQMIVLAGDEDQSLMTIALKLPLPVQVEAVRKIFELTFLEAGGAKKFVDSLTGMVMAMRPTSKED